VQQLEVTALQQRQTVVEQQELPRHQWVAAEVASLVVSAVPAEQLAEVGKLVVVEMVRVVGHTVAHMLAARIVTAGHIAAVAYTVAAAHNKEAAVHREAVVHRVAAGQRVADRTVHMATMVVGGMVAGEGHQPVVSPLHFLSPPCLHFPLSLLPLWLVSLLVGDEEERVAVEAEVLLVHRMVVEGMVGELDMAEVQVGMVEGKDL